jgi:hypothetical protein
VKSSDGDFTGVQGIGFNIFTEFDQCMKDYIKVNITEITDLEEQDIKPLNVIEGYGQLQVT